MSRSTSLVSAFTVAVALALTGASAAAEPFDEADLPPELKPWVPWVLDDVPDHACPAVDGQAICAWPGALDLALAADGGRFVQSATADRPILFPLPGDTAHWPQSVRVNGKAATVVEIEGRPMVRLEAGRWRIEGSLIWRETPEGIHIPPTTAIVSLSIGGVDVEFPRRDDDGLLWLQTGAEAGEEGETLDIEVFRHIADGVPLTVTTKLVLRASGKAREIDLGLVLLENTTVMAVDAGIPARIDKDGHLRVQVRAGTHDVEITARSDASPEKLARRERISGAEGEDPWPADEIWVWRADEALRQVTLAGSPGIDPARTNLPDAWGGLPAFLVQQDTALELTVTRRGEPEPPPDRLVLQRELWMDLDGDGFTVRDQLSGELNRTWRLDLEPPGALGHVSVGGEDQLITANPENEKPGVELRSGSLDLAAEWRIEDGAKQLPAVGWSEDVQELNATLNLPPGWSLISARGVDELPGTWWDEWDLFSFFFVLLVALAIAKLTRWWFGLVALATLVLLHQNPDYPFGVWVFVWVSLLVFLGLLKVLPKGKLHIATRICWWVTALTLVLMLVPYSVDQFRTGLFPQIDEDYDYGDPFSFAAMADYEMDQKGFPLAAPAAPPPAQVTLEGRDLDMELGAVGGEAVDEEVTEEEAVPALEEKAKRKKAEELDRQVQVQIDGSKLGSLADVLDVSSGRYDISLKKRPTKGDFWRQALQQDPKAIVQTGPGVPNWSWKSWSLDWSGPVDREHEIKLYMFSPTINMLLSFLRVILLVLLTLRVALEAIAVVKKKKAEGDPPPAKGGAGKRAAAAGAAVLVGALLVPATARAEEPPPQDVLDQLLDKLTRPEECLPDCVSASRVDVVAADSALRVTAEVHVGARSSWRIPGPAGNWVPKQVSVDGWPTTALALLDDGFLHVRLEPGVHRVEAAGPIPPTDAVTLEFGEPPHRVEVEAPGFSVDGLREDGRAEESIQLTRLAQVGGAGGEVAVDESSYPPWLEVTRTLDLGIPWLVHTTVRRVSPAGSPVMARVPLLPGESVTESELQVEDGEVVLSLGRDDTVLQWSSTLETQPEIALTSPEGKPWSEVWVLSPSPIWTVSHDGLPPVHHKVDGSLRPTFRPWPGESLKLALTRPEGVEGQSVTVDSAHLQVSPGVRLVEASLALSVRSSRGGAQTITLPEKASIQQLTVDGSEQPFRQDGRNVEVTLKPGSQRIEVDWQQPGGITSRYRVPEVKIGGRAANATVTVRLPNDRWLLFGFGPRWGPAVLFWGFLVTILIAALILGRVPLSPLKWWQWALLALGLTQIPVPVSLIIVGWFFVLSWRKSKPPAHFFLHNSLQIVIGLWTLVALICLVVAVYTGLAVQPDMQVAGGGSSNTELNWYVDRVDGAMPTPLVLSLPLLAWKIIMLLWSLWLAWSLVRWSRWGWKAFSHELLWRSIPRRPIPPARQPVPRGGSKPPEAPAGEPTESASAPDGARAGSSKSGEDGGDGES
jgi:hypothetical protein